MENSETLYLDLLKKCLTNLIHGEAEFWPIPPDGRVPPEMISALVTHGLQLAVRAHFDHRLRTEGRDWSPTAHTMIGLKRLDNLQACVEDVLAKEVPGDLMETGVWRGGACIFMRALLKAHGVRDRTVWVADSFQGLPAPDPANNPYDIADQAVRAGPAFKYLAIPLERVKANFERYGLLDDQVRFLEGWFCDTLPTAPVERLAVLRLDGDLYQSTMDALTNLYPKLSVGGYLIVDDFDVPVCRKAVHDYREAHGIVDEIVRIDWTGVYWQRTHG